jgi:Flp pilus assembly protein TadG
MMRRLIQDRSAAAGAEFALVLPLLIVLLLGIIDAGRWMWTYNRGEKAAQMGARFAVVTDPMDDGLKSSYLGVGGLTQGDQIPASDFGKVTCTGAGTAASPTVSCACTTTPCPTLGSNDNTAFQKVYNRLRAFLPEATNPADVKLIYSSSGLGYAGNPSEPDVSPLVTIQISNVPFTPIAGFFFVGLTMPTFTATLTAEDQTGADSN